MHSRAFKIDGQWQMLHEPKKPNGFGVFIFGDVNHYVNEYQSLWMQNEERLKLVEALLDEGYTVFYSNLYGRHWGSPNGERLAAKVYKWVIQQYILNPSVHVLGEGIGALTVLAMCHHMPGTIRSIALTNSCINLEEHLHYAQRNRLFYKSLKNEISAAYECSPDEVHNKVKVLRSWDDFHQKKPIALWHQVNHFSYSLDLHSRSFAETCKVKRIPVELKISIDPMPFSQPSSLIDFFQKHESVKKEG